MKTITQEQWNKTPSDYKGVWTTERTDWPDWEKVRHQYLGKRTLMSHSEGASVLLIEGLSFEIVG